MSTFGGKMEEIDRIRIDNFIEENNEKTEVYFLSHCHSDHMIGLNGYTAKKLFVDRNKYLYASKVSCLILRKKFPGIEGNLKILDMHSPTRIQVGEDIICVTTLPAGHCPGSVMFLFEISNGKTVLYTGDYRINPRDFTKITGFYDSSNHLKKIDNLYLDTTFFLKEFQKFPTRDESLEELCKIITDWIKLDEKNMINLDTSALYGYEFLFLELYNRLKLPIHVSVAAFDVYKYFPDLDKAITRNGNITQIHSSCICQHKICKGYEFNVKDIRVSAMRWTGPELLNGISVTPASDKSLVCYSTHASFEEGYEFIKFLKPKKITPCVEHEKLDRREEMKSLIKMVEEELCTVKVDKSEVEAGEMLFPVEKYQQFEESILRSPPKKMSTESIEESFILDSPPRKMIKEDT